MDNLIYLDNNATTPLDPRVLEVMLPYFTNLFANAASTHSFGVKVNEAVMQAREQVANLLHCKASEIIFTSGATEAINLAIKGIAEEYSHKGKHIVTVKTEHNAVLDTCRYLERYGYEVTYLPVQPDGLLDLETVRAAIRPDTILVSVMFVNNEIGVIHPIQEIANIAHAAGSFFMTDATQAVGKIPVNVNSLGADLLVFSAHKIYGPKGVGALYMRSKQPNKVKLKGIIHGGGHERGLRSGTLNVPSIVGLGKACDLANLEMKVNRNQIEVLRNLLESELLKIEGTFLNGHKSNRIYNVSNICFKGVSAEALIVNLDKVIVSNGSACTASSVEPSHVLNAIGLSDEEAFSSIRFSLGKSSNHQDIVTTLDILPGIIINLREIAKL